MIEKIRQKLLEFIYSAKDVPLLAGFSIGFYVILFYYSRNFALANSLVQILFFTAYYIIMPMAALFAGYKLLSIKFPAYKRNFLFVGMIGFFSFYLIQMVGLPFSKKIGFALIVLIACVLSRWLKGYYKLLVLLLFLMSFFNIKPLLKDGLAFLSTNSEWKKQPDDIEKAVFKKRPNIYYIQPDGYTNFTNLKSKPYSFDNRDFEDFLKTGGFTLYNDYRSNYYSTLLSNSSMFSMKQHYIQADVESYAARGIILNDNAVLKTLKSNKYRTVFLTEKPYLVMNRPGMGYDYCNIPYSEIPFIKDGWNNDYNVIEALEKQINANKNSGNFFFIEKFSPGHIHGFESHSEGVEKERQGYLKMLRESNVWLKKTISLIESKDPKAIIIIGADHGGFVGFKYTLQSQKEVHDKDLIHSVFGAAMAIKWNDLSAKEYDGELKSAVNLFRTVFSFLSEDKKYLNHQDDNSSYIYLKEPKGLYRYINDKGEIVFEKAENVQD